MELCLLRSSAVRYEIVLDESEDWRCKRRSRVGDLRKGFVHDPSECHRGEKKCTGDLQSAMCIRGWNGKCTQRCGCNEENKKIGIPNRTSNHREVE